MCFKVIGSVLYFPYSKISPAPFKPLLLTYALSQDAREYRESSPPPYVESAYYYYCGNSALGTGLRFKKKMQEGRAKGVG